MKIGGGKKMSKFVESTTELIGNTPLLKASKYAKWRMQLFLPS